MGPSIMGGRMRKPSTTGSGGIFGEIQACRDTDGASRFIFGAGSKTTPLVWLEKKL